MKKKKVSLEIVNPYAAGIDIGSRSHFVAIGQDADEVREFGVYAEDLLELAAWLLEHGIKTVAMESTGTYWQNLFSTLQGFGIEVYLVNGKFTKNMRGKKSDVMDCQCLPAQSGGDSKITYYGFAFNKFSTRFHNRNYKDLYKT